MGIRYYAYPVTAEFAVQAHDDPYRFISADPLVDAWDPADERPTRLYLDKCWSRLQQLTCPTPWGPPRPSYRLFEGDVSYVEHGLAWEPWTRVLDPDETAEIARDLVLLDEEDVRDLVGPAPAEDEADRYDYDYVVHYLRQAQEFAARMAREGSGIVYLIG